MMRLRAILFVLVLAFGLAPVARAGLPEVFGIGSRATAMGGAYTAIADDSFAAYYNPAGLAQGNHQETAAGWFFASPNLKINGRSLESQDVSGPVFGLRFPFYMNTQYMAFGLTAFLPEHGSGLLHFKTERPDAVQWPLLDHSAQRLVFMPALSLEVNRHLYLGLGMDLLMNIETEVNLHSVLTTDQPLEGDLLGVIGLGLSDGPPGAGTSGFRLTGAPETRLTAGMLAKFLDDRLRIGASYKAQNEVPLEVKLDAKIDFLSSTNLLFGGLGGLDYGSAFFQIPVLGALNATDFFTPEEASIGIAFDPIRPLTVALDLTWRNWSEFKSIGVDVKFEDIPAFDVPFLLGAPGDTRTVGIGRVSSRPRAEPEFEDIWIPRIGIEYRPGRRVALRAGYAFEPSPVTDTRPTVIRMTLTNESSSLKQFVELVHNEANLADGDKHIISGGIGLSFRDPFYLFKEPMTVDLHIQYLKVAERNFRTDFVPVYYQGDPDILQPTELANPDGRFSASGHIWSLGMVSTIKFY